MKKANVAGLEKMAAGFLQYRWKLYLRSNKFSDDEHKGENNPDFMYYCGACDMIQSMGGEWRREFVPNSDTENIENYSHWVRFPNDEQCNRLNFNAWED